MLKSSFAAPSGAHSRRHSELHEPSLSFRLYHYLVIGILGWLAVGVSAQEKTVWSEQEKPIVEQIKGLRKLDDTVRARTTRELALQIRQLPVVPNKLKLAGALANLSTEGDFGRDTLQEVTTTLASALREQPLAGKPGQPDDLYMWLASLVRYEHMHAELDNPQFTDALSKLEAADAARQQADFTLTDLQGTPWHLRDLKGKVVLVNFWATWCPPCRKEMPDLQALYDKYRHQGFLVLSISDEDAAKVQPFIRERNITYPVLLDPGRKVNEELCLQSRRQAGGTVDRHAHQKSIRRNAGPSRPALIS
jgi:peroxiredoxin